MCEQAHLRRAVVPKSSLRLNGARALGSASMGPRTCSDSRRVGLGVGMRVVLWFLLMVAAFLLGYLLGGLIAGGMRP
jgi:hypothetical protein